MHDSVSVETLVVDPFERVLQDLCFACTCISSAYLTFCESCIELV